METLVTDSPVHAATFIAAGHVVAFPTETVYGLGAPAFSPDSVKKIFSLKDRPADNPIIVHIGRLQDFGLAGRITNEYTTDLLKAFFPGPLTIVVKKTGAVPDTVTAGLDTVGIRMPDHPVGRAFLLACDTPLAAPSANISGRPSPTSWTAVYQDLGEKIPCILNGGRSRVGLESTVVDCTAESPAILRMGAVSLDDLRSVVPGTTVADSVSGAIRSPGIKYRHYAPASSVIVVADPSEIKTPSDSAYIGLSPAADSEALAACSICESVDMYAHILFEFFRECEHRGIRRIYCQAPPVTGVGAALLDRLSRAAASTLPESSAAGYPRV